MSVLGLERVARARARLVRESHALAYWTFTAVLSVLLSAGVIILHLFGG